MINRKAFIERLDRRTLLMIGASVATLAFSLAATPVHAQATLAGILSARANAPRPTTQGAGISPQRPITMNQALSRQRATTSRAEQIRAYVLSARDAVTAANRGAVTDGLSTNGLDPTDTIRQAVAAARAGNADRANQLLVSASANLDDSGLKTWQGAGLPTQTMTADGKVRVTIDQTQQRALLSWTSFNIGANTTLQFNQTQNGVAQPGWIAVNRVTNSVAPSQILGNMQADGTVVVLNQQGIIFGKNAQVNTHSLLASTLELGNAAHLASSGIGTEAATIKDRNNAYLETGLFTPPNGSAGRTGDNLGAALLVSGMTQGNGTTFATAVEGSIVVDPGAQIASGSGGFLILAAPEIDNAGILTAVEGQVSLQAGRAVAYVQSTGAVSDIDPFVRGYKLNSYAYGGVQADGIIQNSGLIESERGYISLGTGADGSITHSGLLSATTSVSRNGKISITSGNILLTGNSDAARASGIEIVADGNGETIPQGSASDPANFKASQIEIGTQIIDQGQPVGGLVATNLTMGENALIHAPGANVQVGVNTIRDVTHKIAYDADHPGHIDIANGAMIDVSGLKDVQLDASRNQIEITPVKRGELRDTPNYREVELDGNFTLNGATLYIDPRIRGVRDDGVAWIGSPLIEASSIASQLPATAAEFMTMGGSVTLTTSNLANFNSVSASTAPSVHIAAGATIDFSGGWVNYAAGTIKTSKLITNDGRIVDINQANQNDVYVGVADGFNSVQPRFGVLKTFLNPAIATQRYDASYDEGRDAGALTINAAAVAIDGSFYGNAFAGSRQINLGVRPSRVPADGGRTLQLTSYELPSGGALSISSLGDMIVYHGNRSGMESDWSELLLSDAMLSGAGLGELALSAAGAVTFAGYNPATLQAPGVLTITGVSDLELAPGGLLSVVAGRTIRFDGVIDAPSGVIDAETVLLGKAPDTLSAGRLNPTKSNGSAFRQGLYGVGNGDDITPDYLYASNPGDLNPFDIIVTGTLSTAGLWVNDFTETGVKRGSAFSDGGSISLTSAARVFAAIGPDIATATEAIDLSGSIRVSGTLNVSSGGYVTPTGGLVLNGKGGNVSLINQTIYASTDLTYSGALNNDGGSSGGPAASDLPIEGTNQSVEFTPLPGRANVDAIFPALVPTPGSTVDISSASIVGFGFAGGGTFTLVAPDIGFGSDRHAGNPHIGLDFFRTTGFGTLDISSYRSRIVDDVFANARVGKSAFLDTTRFVVGAGETLDLTQWMLPTLLSADQSKALRSLGTGADVAAQSFLAPTTNVALWDRRAASLVLGGLTELDVLAGGQITGAPGATMTIGKLYNAGSIVLNGGTITQRNDLVNSLIVGGVGVRDIDLGGHGLADAFGGPVDAQGRFTESALNAAAVTDPSNNNRLLTNQELVTREGADRLIYFMGLVDEGQGVVLRGGSVTDLSGIALINPRAPLLPNGTQARAGRLSDGGTLQLGAGVQVDRQIAPASVIRNVLSGRTLVRQDGAVLDISGASLKIDQARGMGGYTSYLEWSKAGTISALAGGTLGATPVLARGGDSRAEGGTLEWLNPTVGTGSGDGLDYLNADLIADSGFDTLIARGSLALDGDFSLFLRKALMVISRDPIQGNALGSEARVTVNATAGTEAKIAASYVRFASRLGTTALNAGTVGDGEVTFAAGSQGIDIAGGIGFDSGIGTLTLSTLGDMRFIGVNDQSLTDLPRYNGQLITAGDLNIDARRSYATTGTGNLQAILEGVVPATGLPAFAPFDVAALGDHSITFAGTYLDPNARTPLSAGSYLRVRAARIMQNGYVAAPLGVLELGSSNAAFIAGGQVNATQSVSFGAGSITVVSGVGLNIPYGTTIDQIDYFFPTVGTPITKLPAGELRLTGGSIVQEDGARFDGRGGGDVFAYEFQSGVGGSRDVLDRFNRDPFSSNGYDPVTGTGYQYADQRQVFALVPVNQIGKIAPYDPIYSSDYGDAGPVNLYGASAGRSVFLDGGNGVPGGEYLLIPAKYAMSVPGALRLVENSDAVAPVPGTSTRLLDGSVIVGGTFGYADTGISESTRHSFTVQSKDSFLKYSQIETTSGSQYLTDKAAKAGTGRPRLPLDAARVVLAPLNMLRIQGLFDTSPVDGGQGGQFDILGQNIVIAGQGGTSANGALLVQDSTLARLGAASLLIGGQRTENLDGTTSIAASATSITVAGDARLQAPELLLAVGGNGSRLTVGDGAQILAVGTVGTQSDADYVTATGGSLLRVANGAERLVTRGGTGSSTIDIGAATIGGDALALDSSGVFLASDAANIGAKQIAISGQTIRFDGSPNAADQAGVIGTMLEAKLASADRLTVRSPGAIQFSTGTHEFHDLVLDTASLAAVANAEADATVTVKAGDVRLLNSANAQSGCATVGTCGSAGNFALSATSINFGANAVTASGFGKGVTLAGSDGMYVEDKGGFSAGSASLTLSTPFLAERAAAADPREQKRRPDYSFLTTGDFVMNAAGANSVAKITGNAAPGARIGIGTIDARVRSVKIEDSQIRASAGIIDIQSQTDITLANATLEVPGYLATFGDTVDPVVVSAGGGTINLLAANGAIRADSGSKLVSDTGIGSAGTINLLASNGAIQLDAALNPDMKGPRASSLTFDSGTSAFDLADFVRHYGMIFGGDLWVRSGAGDLRFDGGQNFKAQSVALTAEGGAISIAGTIDTSGVDVSGMSADAARDALVNGGDIALWGNAGVTLTSTARLDTHTTGYAESDSRVASAGNVTIGIERQDAAITVENGAMIDVGARRTQAEPGVGRLVPQVITDPATGNPTTVYRYADPDSGGTVAFRAPVIGAGHDKVALSQRGTIQGADSIQLEAFQRYDLDSMAESGLYSGIRRGTDGTILLDFGATGQNPFTEKFTLADGTGSLVQFIQDFEVSTVDGSSLDGMRLRPGVELASKGDIGTSTQWNLGAATFSPAQLQAAVDAGVLQVIPQLSQGGATQYRVVPGREGDLLDRFATFLYRTDGSARGEAPVVTLRAGGDLTINRSISDGFFTFRDKSDAGYMSWQLGGGNRPYQPALQFTCGSTTGNCGTIPSYRAGASQGAANTLTIALGSQATRGASPDPAFINSPLALAGNGADGGGEGGDALGFGELFPLLDGNVAMHSSDVRLVAGAGETLSANPLQVNRAAAANVTLTGEYGYAVTATGAANYGGALQFHLARATSDTNNVNFNIGDTLDLTSTIAGLNQVKDDANTQLNWGTGSTGLAADVRAAAQAYFAGKGYSFVGSGQSTSGITAPLNVILGFMKSFEQTYLTGLSSGRVGYAADRTLPIIRYGTAGQQASPTAPNRAYVRTYVRTGDGAIAVAAAQDIDLRGGTAAEYRKADGTLGTMPTNSFSPDAGQFAASAIYTAGVRVAPTSVTAQLPDGNLLSIVPDSPYFTLGTENVAFIPSPKALTDNQAVLAHDGGDIDLEAGRDILARRESWDELFGALGQAYSGASTGISTNTGLQLGQKTQLWRTGTIGLDTELGLQPRYFVSGVGALAGGDVTINAGRDVSDLTVALLSGVTSTTTGAGPVMLTLGGGNLDVSAGRDILAGRFDIASGRGDVAAGGDIASLGFEPVGNKVPQYLRVRLSDAVMDVSAGGSVTLGSVSALGVDSTSPNSAGFFSPTAALTLQANGNASIAQTLSVDGLNQDYGQQPAFYPAIGSFPSAYVYVMPPTLRMVSLSGSVMLPVGAAQLLYPSTIGQLQLYSAGDISGLVIAMSDSDPATLGGAFAAPQPIRDNAFFQIPYVTSNTTDAQLRSLHSSRITHLDDPEPVRIYSNGDISDAAIFLPKQARITAAGDIVDMFFNGQNLLSSDITRIRSGGDILGTNVFAGLKPYIQSNDFILGGPGSFIVEAGRDLGPFVTSANVASQGVLYSFAGGIRTVGNDYNPWLSNQGGDLSIRFGMAAGADYAGLRETYLNPDHQASLDGDLFVQVTDSFGNQRPDRTKPIYAPILAAWLRDNYPDLFASVFGNGSFSDAGALAAASYMHMGELYAAFAKIDLLHQQSFLINNLYFNELAAVGEQAGPSFNQFIRGYRAANTLFPPSLGYTDNLAPYTTGMATISPDHPLGDPVRNIVNGEPQKAERVLTGNVDLRLATIQSARGGDVSILGPGGDVIAGSVVRTASQSALRNTAFPMLNGGFLPGLESGSLNANPSAFVSVPLGYEGVLTLRGGDIRSFTDGSFILNQSRVFSQAGGDIVMWSSNGDLNAGQGPKSASNFPPITVRLDENGFAEVNSAGSVSGAGIGTFRQTPDSPASNVLLIAPVGEVDAGDAGVRASGNVVVAAARVANADNFKAAGQLTGVPTSAMAPTAVTPASAASAVAAQAAGAAKTDTSQSNRRSLITVDVLGPVAADGTCPPDNPNDPDCR
ncbi:MAG TPA: filamentous hemagglutinin family protein [Sphingobium sp.]|uniref:filamentous haemagglutinin family protein n=1 Tax=Sphingobium sp. TaxID=1912891 RepID=UPI002ED32C54